MSLTFHLLFLILISLSLLVFCYGFVGLYESYFPQPSLYQVDRLPDEKIKRNLDFSVLFRYQGDVEELLREITNMDTYLSSFDNLSYEFLVLLDSNKDVHDLEIVEDSCFDIRRTRVLCTHDIGMAHFVHACARSRGKVVLYNWVIHQLMERLIMKDGTDFLCLSFPTFTYKISYSEKLSFAYPVAISRNAAKIIFNNIPSVYYGFSNRVKYLSETNGINVIFINEKYNKLIDNGLERFINYLFTKLNERKLHFPYIRLHQSM